MNLELKLREQKAYYQATAGDFDQDHWLGSRGNRCHRAKIVRICRQLNLRPGQRVLEVGTGTGIHAATLMRLCSIEYFGADLSDAMLSVARRRLGGGVQLLAAPAERLPLESECFDAVFCSGTLHHVADRARAVSEMSRVVKVGGRVAVAEPNPWNPLNLLAWTTNPLERGMLQMRKDRLRAWFRDSALAIAHTEFFNFTPPRPARLGRLLDVIDVVASRMPVVRRVASMMLVVGIKQGRTEPIYPNQTRWEDRVPVPRM